MPGAKGDGELPYHLSENKATSTLSLRLELKWLQKIAAEARALGKAPLLTFQFVDDRGRPKKDAAWVCIPEPELRELLERAEDGSL